MSDYHEKRKADLESSFSKQELIGMLEDVQRGLVDPTPCVGWTEVNAGELAGPLGAQGFFHRRGLGGVSGGRLRRRISWDWE